MRYWPDMKTFYFNTGVTCRPPFQGEVLRGGTIQIPFDCDNVPEGAVFLFACSDPDIKTHHAFPTAELVVREIHNSNLCSRYAYFRCPVIQFPVS